MLKEAWTSAVDSLKSTSDGAAVGILNQCAYRGEMDNGITVGVSGDFAINYIKKNLLPRMQSLLKERSGRDIALTFLVDPSLVPAADVQHDLFGTTDIEKKRHRSSLNEHYTFDNYISGKNNDYVVAVAMRVAKSPGTQDNPFFFHGGVGLGKTHLLQAIGNYIIANDPAKKVIYIGGGAFLTEFVDSLNSRNANRFRKKYSTPDILLLDDIQQLQKAVQTSKELFEIYQTLEQHGRQMVFVSDRPPKELENLDERLRNRFEKNVIGRIEPPLYETRLAIIRTKLDELSTDIDGSIIEYLAQNISTDVRKIEGALKSYIARRDLMNVTLSLEECIDAGVFNDYCTTSGIAAASPKDVLRAVAKVLSVPADVILGKDRTRTVSYARHLAVYLALTLSNRSTTEIGAEFNRDHSSVVHARHTIIAMMREKTHVAEDIERIKNVLSGRTA
ncbi:MAG: chromosomal replication initiator protein DnaA [Spirochaetota bacterium]